MKTSFSATRLGDGSGMKRSSSGKGIRIVIHHVLIGFCVQVCLRTGHPLHSGLVQDITINNQKIYPMRLTISSSERFLSRAIRHDKMQHPFQCALSISAGPSQEYLLAACGSNLLTFCTKRKNIVSQWSPRDVVRRGIGFYNQRKRSNRSQITDASSAIEDAANNGEPPAKKVKHENNNTSKPPQILKLVASPDNKSVVIITDDKAVRVLALGKNGQLAELSQRCMPKRPCAVEVLPDNATILVGDKFGDVYSLPLFPSEDDPTAQHSEGLLVDAPAQRESDFKPTATNLTVHTKRNRMALEAQMKQTNLTPRKEGAKFEHKLLLGHVSMLTDMATAVVATAEGKSRQYIITADRDEHIRVSRGPPQAHVIEGYCLGHTEFISKIRLTGDSQLLFSGGGDDWLGLWDWPASQLIQKVDLRAPLSSLSDIDPTYGTPTHAISVSGIWTLPLQQSLDPAEVLIVALEKVPALFVATVRRAGTSSPQDQPKAQVSEFAIIRLAGNPLDLITCGSSSSSNDHRQQIIVSLDCRAQGQDRLQIIEVQPAATAPQPANGDGTTGVAPAARIIPQDRESQSAEHQDLPLAGLNRWQSPASDSSSTSVGAGSEKELEDLLYGMGNLRKRGGTDAELGIDEGTTATAAAGT